MNKIKCPDSYQLDTIFHECRQCGSCCKTYRKILLQDDEIDTIKKLGGHVGVDVHLNDLREKTMEQLVQEAKGKGKIFMIHPDDSGCVFLEKRDGKYRCKIYHYRPKSCQGFKCNLADSSFTEIFGNDSMSLLGMDSFGQPLER